MKLILITIIFCTSALAKADCLVQSKLYPELQTGLNAEVICRETTTALEQSFAIRASDYDVVILANGKRTYSSVELDILLKEKKKTKYRVAGSIYWGPDGSFVEINK